MSIIEGESSRTFSAGEVVFSEGDLGHEMYVIQSGSVEVTIDIDGEPHQVSTLERGDFFGEMSLLETLPRSATVRCLEETSVLTIHSGTLLLRIRRDPTFAFEIIKRMSHKIRSTNHQLTELKRELGQRHLDPVDAPGKWERVE
ncbi:cyclic nucleotide-binding domain-containing protein [Magnetovibrio sp. PR-2]|uniref:Crp/Fnr family transcriptional regulator n=1 Tax=Magnetovibrio sp. PR-2 TaxID=3120356 RepID=UPI002FCE2DE3